MAFSLDNVVPWGRDFDEYVAMFALSGQDLEKRILGAGDGPAAFNARLARQGGNVISTDPIYQFSADEISRRIDVSYHEVMEQTRKNRDEFVWNHVPSVEELGRIRKKAMSEFLDDYSGGANKGRYIAGKLPDLPFRDQAFDIALCSHFLFLYGVSLSTDFHVQSIMELCRVASQARLFPLLELGARKSRHLDPVVARLKERGYQVNIETAPYEFQKGGDQMLKVTHL